MGKSAYTFHHKKIEDHGDVSHHEVTVKDSKKNKVGYLRYFKQTTFGEKKPHLYTGYVHVSEPHRRKGLATKLHNEATALHKVPFRESQHQTPDGAKLTQSLKKKKIVKSILKKEQSTMSALKKSISWIKKAKTMKDIPAIVGYEHGSPEHYDRYLSLKRRHKYLCNDAKEVNEDAPSFEEYLKAHNETETKRIHKYNPGLKKAITKRVKK
ncbi:MAG: GNAT family N-acetyltransferase [Pseudobdellovibrionaceae bacterium]